jgi:4-diphosphocytidyl-2-C-methyl-D-erythritol kinase
MPLFETARAKINLTLRVVGRRADGHHGLESLVAFAELADGLSLEPGDETPLEVVGRFGAASGPAQANLVLKAAAALAALIPDLKTGHFRLDKHIPVAAGLGGGSSDAAAALRLLACRNALTADDPRLLAAARATGSDVPVCLVPRAKIMRGIGEELSPPVRLPKLAAVLANPGIAVATKDVFAAFDQRYASTVPIVEVPTEREPLIVWLAGTRNDLTDAACTRAPAIRDVLAALSSLSGCRLARMSGSGATCFALFDAADEADYAAERLRAQHPAWWISATALG